MLRVGEGCSNTQQIFFEFLEIWESATFQVRGSQAKPKFQSPKQSVINKSRVFSIEMITAFQNSLFPR